MEIKALLPLFIENCETLIKQTHRKAKETVVFKLTKPTETSSFKAPISTGGSLMIGLTILEVSNSIYNITEEKNKFKFYRDIFDESSFTEVKDETEEILGLSDITPSHIQH